LRFLQVLWNLITGKSDSLHLADEVAEALKLKAEEETHEHRHPLHHAVRC
jgi:hypothetical protein